MSGLRMEFFTQISANGPLIIYFNVLAAHGVFYTNYHEWTVNYLFNEWAAHEGAMQNYNLLEGGSMSMSALLAKVIPYYIFEQY